VIPVANGKDGIDRRAAAVREIGVASLPLRRSFSGGLFK
jgi:hypothetical protein